MLHWKNRLKNCTLFSFVLLLSLNLQGQEFTRTIDKTVGAKSIVEFKQEKGDLFIEKSTDGKISWSTKLSVTAKSEAAANQLFDKVETDISEGSQSLSVEIDMHGIKNWNENNRGATIVFKDGTKLKDVRNFKLRTVLYLPATQELSLENKFKSIEIASDVSINDLEVVLYHADLRGHDVNGNLELKQKFSDVELNQVKGTTEATLYHADLELEGASEVHLKSQFSKVKMGNIAKITSTSYHDKVRVTSIDGKFKLDSKFSDWICDSAGNTDLTTYHGSVTVEEIKSNFDQIDVNGKFTNIDLELPKSAQYQINATLNFGGFSAPDNAIFTKQIEKHNKKEYILKSANATDSSPQITIEAYHGKVKLD